MSVRPHLLAALAPVILAPTVALASVPVYISTGSFGLPSANLAFDVDNQGRVVSVDSSGQIRRQSSPTSSVHSVLGSLPGSAPLSFGASFVRLGNSGQVAIGDNGVQGRVYSLNLGDLSTSTPTVPASTIVPNNYDALWVDSSTLIVAGTESFIAPASVYRASIGGPRTEVISNIGAGSGGLAQRSGSVYSGVGFGTGAGDVRAFSLAALQSASGPTLFSSGSLAASANTASALSFDGLGNLVVAGSGGVRIINLTTNSIFDLQLPTSGFYFARFSETTGEILVKEFNDSFVSRWSIIPAPAALPALAVGSIFAFRRKRHA